MQTLKRHSIKCHYLNLCDLAIANAAWVCDSWKANADDFYGHRVMGEVFDCWCHNVNSRHYTSSLVYLNFAWWSFQQQCQWWLCATEDNWPLTV